MDDVNRHEVDTRLRETLRPPTAVIDRVLAGARARQHSREPAHRWRWAGVTAAALLIAALVIWQRAAPREPAVPVTTVSRDASMLVVQSSDGRRWPPSDVLNMLCSMARCQWQFDSVRGLRLIALP